MDPMSPDDRKRWSELRAAEARFRTIFENAPFMINSFDREGKVVLWNRACMDLLGYSREEMERAKDPLLLFYPEPELRDRVLADITRADGCFREYLVCRKDGARVVQMWANFPLPDETIISVGYDVTAMRDVQDRLRDANLNLEQKVEERTRELDRERARLVSTSKFAELGEMAGGIAHEINNPLAVIAGLADQLQAMEGNDSLRREMLANIRSSVTRISKIVSGLRSISRDASRDPLSPHRADDIVRETLGFCGERFRKTDIRLEAKLGEGDLTLSCRAVEIGQVLLNLLNNAFDAVQESAEKWVLVSVAAEEAGLCLRVTDSGAGVPAGLEERVFQPFFTLKPIGRGTGLGLSISRGIAEAHGGSLVYEPEAGRSSFALRLPRGGKARP